MWENTIKSKRKYKEIGLNYPRSCASCLTSKNKPKDIGMTISFQNRNKVLLLPYLILNSSINWLFLSPLAEKLSIICWKLGKMALLCMLLRCIQKLIRTRLKIIRL